MLTLGSLFDGMGGWRLAAVHAGVKPVWSSENEPFPIEETKRHFPDTIQLGDVIFIDGKDGALVVPAAKGWLEKDEQTQSVMDFECIRI